MLYHKSALLLAVGLRDYGTGEWEGGDPGCSHTRLNPKQDHSHGNWLGTRDQQPASVAGASPMRDVCGRCAARRIDRQIGLEPTPDEFVARLVEVFREVRRVLRDDGTLWLNMGDSYCAALTGSRDNERERIGWDGPFKVASTRRRTEQHRGRDRRLLPDAKPKDLLGIPWLLAFALRADGWYLRSDIIWSKPNPMPESVTDRPTSAHEHVFLLTKSARYFYDADAIREDIAPETAKRYEQPFNSMYARAQQASVTDKRTDGAAMQFVNQGRNKRNVWEIATQPFPEAHFATFPTKLVEPCVLAGSSPQACGECGAPWQRVVERIDNGRNPDGGRAAVLATGGAITGGTEMSTLGHGGKFNGENRTTGWEPTCDHQDDTGSSVILDPFAGSGTTGLVALRYGRSFIGLELNPEYVALARRRIVDDAPLLNQMAEAVA